MRHQTELLAPAGSIEGLRAAVNAGADAVYVGGTRFGARAYADNPDEKELVGGIRYAHLHDCDVYLTVNTLFRDAELEELGTFLKPYYEAGLDAVIIQDMGAFKLVREMYPDLDIHASTQMNVTGEDGAAFLRRAGAKRVVTARELSLGEISRIHEKVDIEIESFIHGALCYCYSGQCLISSMFGGRSGNRGRCAQPCRLPYRLEECGGKKTISRPDEPYILSPKDICTIEILPEIIASGVCSLKIEGRMKRPEYTAGVTRIYRKYLDIYLEKGTDNYSVSKEDYDELLALYNRGGFSEGYYKTHNGRKLISLKTPKHFDDEDRDTQEKRQYESMIKRLGHDYLENEKKERINGEFRVAAGAPAVLKVSCRGSFAEAFSEPAQEALNLPLTAADVEKQLRKTGGTPFEFDKLDIHIEGSVFCPAGQLNRLRREALEGLEKKLSCRAERKSPVCAKHPAADMGDSVRRMEGGGNGTHNGGVLNVQIEDASLLDTVLGIPEVDGVYLTSSRLDFAKLPQYAGRCHAAGKRCLLVAPAVFRLKAREFFMERLKVLRNAGLDGIVVGNIDSAAFFFSHAPEIPLAADHSLYSWNRCSRKFWMDNGIGRDTLPLELNAPQLRARGCAGSELVVYGYLPLMTTAGCLKKTVKGCDRKDGALVLKDRYNTGFTVSNNCRFCYNTIYNSVPLSLAGETGEIEKLAPASLRLIFTSESPEEVKTVVKGFTGRASASEGAHTKGHFRRGVL